MTKKEAGFFHRLRKKSKVQCCQNKKKNNQNFQTLYFTIFVFKVSTRAMGQWIHGKFCHTIWRKNIIVCTHYLGSFLEKWKMFGESGNQNGNLSENMCISEFWLLQANSDLECTSHIGLILRVKKFILLNFRLLKMYNTCMCQFLTSKYRKVVIRSRPRLEDALEL